MVAVEIPQVVSAKTADYTILANDGGALFTNRGAGGAVNFTLPTVAAVGSGWWVDIHVVADQTVTVTAGTADTLVVFNDAAADSIAFAGASQKIGNGVRVICDGTGWLLRYNVAPLADGLSVAATTIVTA